MGDTYLDRSAGWAAGEAAVESWWAERYISPAECWAAHRYGVLDGWDDFPTPDWAESEDFRDAFDKGAEHRLWVLAAEEFVAHIP